MKYVMAVSSGTTPAPVALTVVTSFLPDGIVGTAYTTTTLEATGGTAPYTWTEVELLPPGLTLSSAGVITGTPTDAGSFTVRVQVRDSVGATADSGTLPVTIASANTLRITTANLANGRINVAYSATLAATGGSGTGYSFSVSAGSLPSGLSLSAAGVISGTPTAAGTSSVTFRVTDSLAATADSGAYQLTIDPAFPLEIVSVSPLNTGEVGEAYSRGLVGTGGIKPYTWAVTGSLPDGLTLDTETGVISGTPTTEETASFTITLSDDASASTFRVFDLTINAAGTVEGPHDFFDAAVASQYHYRSWSLRSESEIDALRKRVVNPQHTHYIWPDDSFVDAQDAAKIVVPDGVVDYENLRMPLNVGAVKMGVEEVSLLLIWDFYWDQSYIDAHIGKPIATAVKMFQCSAGATDHVNWEPDVKFIGRPGGANCGWMCVRTYAVVFDPPAAKGGDGVDFRDVGGNHYLSESLGPMEAEFNLKPNTWTRFWAQLVFRNDSTFVYTSFWVADEIREPVQIIDNLGVGWPLKGTGSTPGYCQQFWIEHDTSQETRNPGDWIAYTRNVVALLDVPDVNAFLVKPVR